MYTIIKLRRTAVLLFTFGAGWLMANMASQWLLVLYSVAVILWFMFYDFAMENHNQNETKRKYKRDLEKVSSEKAD